MSGESGAAVGDQAPDDATQTGDGTLPGPFDGDPRGNFPQSPPVANASEPSVFSTQIGEGHTPERPEDLCEVEFFLPLDYIARRHEDRCDPNLESLVAPTAPRITLSSAGRPEDFLATFDAECDNKGWEMEYSGEFIFVYDYHAALQRPRIFDLTIEIFRKGAWEEAAHFTSEVFCPSPPPPDCDSDPSLCDESGGSGGDIEGKI